MSDWLGLGLIAAVLGSAVWFFSAVGKPYQVTPEEFERRTREGGTAKAGLFGLMQALQPKQAKAIEIQRNVQSGYYHKKQRQGDLDDLSNDLSSGVSETNETIPKDTLTRRESERS